MTTEHWIDLTANGRTDRHILRPGLTRFGGVGCDVVIEGSGEELHLWSDPPKAVRVGEGSQPLLNGRAFEEAPLEGGDSIQWGAAVLVYGRSGAALVEELTPAASPAASPAPGSAPGSASSPAAVSAGEGRFLQRLHAGVLVDLGLANSKGTQRWQDAVVRGQFDADSCARDLLVGDVPDPDDPRVLERAGRLQRDLLMMPMQRGIKGASRRTRAATRRGTAIVLANVIAISVYSGVLVAIMVLVRVNYEFSFDAVIDRFLNLF